jgi:hypothetical protein
MSGRRRVKQDRRAVRFPIVGISEEAIRHHANQHPCGDVGCRIKQCPCGTTIVIVCIACHEAVFLSVAPWTWCEHAEALWAGGEAA